MFCDLEAYILSWTESGSWCWGKMFNSVVSHSWRWGMMYYPEAARVYDAESKWIILKRHVFTLWHNVLSWSDSCPWRWGKMCHCVATFMTLRHNVLSWSDSCSLQCNIMYYPEATRVQDIETNELSWIDSCLGHKSIMYNPWATHVLDIEINVLSWSDSFPWCWGKMYSEATHVHDVEA